MRTDYDKGVGRYGLSSIVLSGYTAVDRQRLLRPSVSCLLCQNRANALSLSPNQTTWFCLLLENAMFPIDWMCSEISGG